MLRWYQAQLARRPVLTQSITTAFLFGAGDILAQQWVEKKSLKEHDMMRTTRMVSYGGLIFGPVATHWYRLLQRHINLSTQGRTIAARVAADQLAFTPVHMTVFLSSMAFLEGWPPRKKPPARSEARPGVARLEPERVQPAGEATARERIEERLRTTWWTAFSRNLMVWPAVQAVNFSIVPLEYRLLVVNVVALGWNCYLSYLNSNSSSKNGKEE